MRRPKPLSAHERFNYIRRQMRSEIHGPIEQGGPEL